MLIFHRIASLSAGKATSAGVSGWRTIFWIQAGFFALTIFGLLVFYHPKKKTEAERLSWRNIFWACDPIGSLLFIISATLMLMALDWVGGVYEWHDKHVVAPLTIGLVCLLLFVLYGKASWRRQLAPRLTRNFRMERKKRWPCCSCILQRGTELRTFRICICCRRVSDNRSNLFHLLTSCSWIFYSAVNSITPLIVLNLGFESTAWRISVRQLSFQAVVLFSPIPIGYVLSPKSGCLLCSY